MGVLFAYAIERSVKMFNLR